MPEVDFTNVGDITVFTPLPEGQYHCKLVNIRMSFTQSGEELWRLRWMVTQGEYKNRFLFDNLVFSDAALKRVKLICSCLGIDTEGKVTIGRHTLIGKTCYVSVVIEEYEDSQGNVKSRNSVPYTGYSSTPLEAESS